jgi:hypothetical protein
MRPPAQSSYELDRLFRRVQGEQSEVRVLAGEAGIGRTASVRPSRIEAVRATGVQVMCHRQRSSLRSRPALVMTALVSRLQAASARVLHHREDLVLHIPKPGHTAAAGR